MSYLKIENLCKSYNDKEIFSNINITLEKGEVCAILGRSGIGKTTIFNILAGFEECDKGKVLLNNEVLDFNKFNQNISYMQQKHLLLPHLTIFENICIPLKIQKVKKYEIFERVENVLKQFGLWDIKDKLPCEISGGMRQRISFIRAYLKTKNLILLDEPFSSLDNITKFEIYTWFNDIIRKEKITVLFITHDIQEAIALSDKIYIMQNDLEEEKKTFFIKNKKEKISEFLNSEEFFEYYNKILKLFC